LNDKDPQSHPRPTIVPRSDHCISRADISKTALKVLYRLRKAGYQAFLVGGGVRDLLVGSNPKDFDVATDAHPEQVRELFGNSRLIGRRFKLAHVRFGRDIVEVVTFRGAASDGRDVERQQADSGRILRDNVYGSIEEDVWRRDFTVNALYYNVEDFSIWDYTGGMADIQSRQLRLIGDPETRYREDPVRMLRAVRLAAKLDFDIAAATGSPIKPLGALLRDVPPARLFDETLKLFQTGHACRSLELLQQHDLLQYLFPFTADAIVRDARGHVLSLIRVGLESTDSRINAGQSVTPMFLYAVMLWSAIRQRATELIEAGNYTEIEAAQIANDEIVSRQQHYTAYPRRFSAPMREMLVMQYRFATRRGVRALRVLEHKRFRAAYDFLLIRAACGEVESTLAQWWTDVQAMPPDEQRRVFDIKRRRRRRPRRSKHRPAGEARSTN